MELVLKRIASLDSGTFGVLMLDGKPWCTTLEDPWNNNIEQISCIPAGSYLCAPHDGPRVKDVWEVTKVPGRTAILIHSGNTIADTEGCILVGQGFGVFDGIPGVINSVGTLNMLRAKLPEQFTLTVQDSR